MTVDWIILSKIEKIIPVWATLKFFICEKLTEVYGHLPVWALIYPKGLPNEIYNFNKILVRTDFTDLVSFSG